MGSASKLRRFAISTTRSVWLPTPIYYELLTYEAAYLFKFGHYLNRMRYLNSV